MNRRKLLQASAAAMPVFWAKWACPRSWAGREAVASLSRVRPEDKAWPSQEAWNRLKQDVGGQLVRVRSPLKSCLTAASGSSCDEVFKELKNPYYLGDEVGLTQTLGWVGAWTSQPSAYAVAARTTGDVVAAVNFARQNNLRLVVKGGGHSYQGPPTPPIRC